jgi:hypothetical protein
LFGLVIARLFLFPQLKCVLKGRFVSVEEVTEKATSLIQVSENGFQESFQKLFEH